MFNAKTYIERRKRLMNQIGSGLILFLGNNESSMNYADNTYHFRQDSSFLYFFGLDFPQLAGVIEKGNWPGYANPDFTASPIFSRVYGFLMYAQAPSF